MANKIDIERAKSLYLQEISFAPVCPPWDTLDERLKRRFILAVNAPLAVQDRMNWIPDRPGFTSMLLTSDSAWLDSLSDDPSDREWAEALQKIDSYR